MLDPSTVLIRIALLLACCLWPLTAATADPKPEPKRDVLIGIHEAPPFVTQDDDGEWTGLSIELWKRMAADAGIRYRFQAMELEPMLAALSQHQVDLAVGAISLTAPREKYLDLTHPYLVAGLGIVTHAQASTSLWSVLLSLLSGDLLKALGIIAAWLLLSGFLVWLFEHRRNPQMFGGDVRHGVGSGFWWALVTLTTVGYGDKSPKTIGGRMVATVWMILSLVVLSSLTAAITSSMTVQTLSGSIQGPEDLPGKRVATVTGSASETWLKKREIEVLGFRKLDQALSAVQAGQADAVVYDAPILNHVLSRGEHGELRLLERQFQLHFYGFALPQGSEYLEVLNRSVLHHINDDEWLELRREFLGSGD